MSKFYLLSIGILLATIGNKPVFAQPAVSIHDIQFTTDPSGDSPMANSVVKTYGIVTGIFSIGATNTFFIQDGEGQWNGLYINTNAYTVAVGDSVEVIGTIEEYFGLTQMSNVQSLNIISSGNDIPQAEGINLEIANYEAFESVYIQVLNATCTEDDSGLGQFIIDDGHSSCIVDDDIFHYEPQEQNIYHLSGIRYFYLGEIKLFPTKAEDIHLVAAVSIEEDFANFSVFPNPANDLLNIITTSNVSYTLYDMQGKLIVSGSGDATINLQDYESGLYHIKISDGVRTKVIKVIVQK